MTCKCGNYDECDGSYAVAYPLQDGASCAVVPCSNSEKYKEVSEYKWTPPPQPYRSN